MKRILIALVVVGFGIVAFWQFQQKSNDERLVETTFVKVDERNPSGHLVAKHQEKMQSSLESGKSSQREAPVVEFTPEEDIDAAIENYAKYCGRFEPLYAQLKRVEKRLEILRPKLIANQQSEVESSEFDQLEKIDVQLRTVLSLCAYDDVKSASKT